MTSYQVTSNPAGIVAVGTASPVTVIGLTDGTAYTFTVTATNSSGTGPASAATNSVTPQPAVTVPGPPTAVTATAGDGTATVSFTAPVGNGGASITGYTVTSAPGPIIASGTSSPVTVSGLTDGTTYTFTVVATNANGTGAASAASNSVTPQPSVTVPGAPGGLSATPGNAQVALCWTPPTTTGGATISGYLVAERVSPSGAWTIMPQATATTATVAGLANGVAYDFQVSAVNSAGPGSPSGTVTAIAATVPGMPTSVVAVAGNASATVSFAVPASTGGASITSYTVTSTPGNVVATATASPITVNGLTNGANYTFTVTATNSVGTGPVSSASAPVQPLGVNLLPDSGFESGNGGWVPFTAGTLARVTTPVHGGSEALQVASPNSTVGLVGLTQNTVVSESVAGESYTVSCYVWPTAAGLSVTARFLEYAQNWSTVIRFTQITKVASLPVGVWTLVSVTSTAVNSAERMVPQLYSTNETSVNGRLVYDDCAVTTA